MRKTFTKGGFLASMAIFLLVSGINAQTATLRVPEEYAHVRDALFALKGGNMTHVTDALILVGEGNIRTTAGFGNIRRAVKVTVQGAGADKTIISGWEDADPLPDIGSGGRRFFNQNEDTNAGSEFIFKDLTFKKWGFGDGNGGAVLNLTGINQKATFINCHFEQIQAEKGAIIISNKVSNVVTFENCFFKDVVSFDRGGMNGMIYVNGGTLVISNSTFMSNSRNPVTAGESFNEERGVRKAGVISLESYLDAPLGFAMTNCTFVNNQTTAAAGDFIQPMISFYPQDGAMEVDLKGNMMIGNLRAGKENDVDIYVDNMDKITWVNSANVMNRALKRVVDGENESFVPAGIPGFLANADYNYTHSSILFEMENDLPKILVDEFGVNYVKYNGQNVGIGNKADNSTITAYPNPSNGFFNILAPHDLKQANYEVYNSIGGLVKRGMLTDDHFIINLSDSNRGLYILRISSGSQNFSQRLIVK